MHGRVRHADLMARAEHPPSSVQLVLQMRQTLQGYPQDSIWQSHLTFEPANSSSYSSLVTGLITRVSLRLRPRAGGDIPCQPKRKPCTRMLSPCMWAWRLQKQSGWRSPKDTNWLRRLPSRGTACSGMVSHQTPVHQVWLLLSSLCHDGSGTGRSWHPDKKRSCCCITHAKEPLCQHSLPTNQPTAAACTCNSIHLPSWPGP